MSKALSPGQEKMITLRDFLDKKEGVIGSVIHKTLDPHTLTRLALMAVGQMPDLLVCTPVSVLQCVMTAAELGLRPGGARAQIHFVKFKNVAQPIIDYRGFAHIVRRANPGTDVRARVVYAGDEFEMEMGSVELFKHVMWEFSRAEGRPTSRGEIVGAYCATENEKWPRTRFDVMARVDIERRRDVSKAYLHDKKKSIWTLWEDMMFRKTAVKFHCNMQEDQGGEIARAMEIDDAVESGKLIEVTGYDMDGEDPSKAALPREASSGKASDALAQSLMGGAAEE